MFASLIVEPNTKNLSYTYSKPFQILSDLVEMTNNSKAASDAVKKPKTFELPERTDLSTQTGELLYAYPEMRCLVDYVGTYYKEFLEKLSIAPQVKPALAYAK